MDTNEPMSPMSETTSESMTNEKQVDYIIKLPANTKFEIETFNSFLQNGFRILKNVPFAVKIKVVDKTISYAFVVSELYRELLENQFYSIFPEIEIASEEYDLTTRRVSSAAAAEVSLKYGDFFPFAVYDPTKGSFLQDIFNQLNRLTNTDVFELIVKIQPVDIDRLTFTVKRSFDLQMRNVQDSVNLLDRLTSKKGSPEVRNRANVAAREKNKQPLFLTEIEMVLFSDNYSLSYAKLMPIVQVFSKLQSEFNEFKFQIKPLATTDMSRMYSPTLSKRALHLSSQEVSTIFHFPVDTDGVPNLKKILSQRGEPPVGLPTPDNTPAHELCLFGKTNYRNFRQDFGVKYTDRSKHMYLVGKSGSGKSKLQELLIKNDIEQGKGICVIDPHGDLIEDIISYIPESRVQDVIYFNAIDEDFPIAFNPIEKVDKMNRQQVATGFIEIFKKAFGSNWTPRLEHVLRMSILALLDAPKASVMSILLLLTDRNYRQEVIKTIDDQVVKNFWTNEFSGWTEKFDSEAIMPILNKIGQFVSNSLIRNIVAQEENKVKLNEIMDTRKILLIKLPKGVLGEENTSLLGAMVINKIYQAALARATIAESDRVPFYLYVDEFQNFATDSFTNILSESRKYKLSLTVAHQYISQLAENIKKTIFGNVGTIISFRIGSEDAVILEQEFKPKFKVSDLTNLGTREMYIKMTINDQVREAFSAESLNVPPPGQNFKNEIVAYTRANYCQQRAVAEGEIQEEKSKELEIIQKLKEDRFTAPMV